MNMRVRQLWAPVLSTFLVSVSMQFVALRVPQWPPWVFFTPDGVSIVLPPLWLLALPFIGALGAWLSLRADGNTRDRLLTALGPACSRLSYWHSGPCPGWDARPRCGPGGPPASSDADRLVVGSASSPRF